jgi:protein tyrosine phosphatase (PTP) superfamily phosphohydrolase (DUF442 family)
MQATEHPLERIYNYRSVDERLATGGQPSEEQLRAVAQAGFEVVINLALHDDPRYSLPDEAGVVNSLGMTYEHIPVQFASPTEADLESFFLAMERSRGKKIFVHCAANKRVSAFVGLYRVLKLEWPTDRAFDLLSGIWQPDAVWSQFLLRVLEKHGVRGGVNFGGERG